MAGFNGLRVLSFESRRAKEIALLISNNGGVPVVAPSTREVPSSNDDERKFLRDILDQRFDAVIFMTGVGARALVEAAESMCPREEFLAALRRTRIVVRGPKPAAVMREFNIPTALRVPEPNTWREIVQVLDSNEATLPLKAKRIAVQEHGQPSPQLYEALRERGAEVFPVRVYSWELPQDTAPLKAAVRALVNRAIDIALFTSSVQLVHASRIAGQIGLKDHFIEALKRSVVASIGPVTSEVLRKNGITVDFEPSHPKMGILVREAAENSEALLRKKAEAKNAH